MHRIDELFQRKPEEVLNIYFTAGYPKLDDTRTILKSLQDSGADLIEIGIPFSDPVADGPTIQQSNEQALENGMTMQKLFEQLEGFRNEVDVPVVVMGYFNPIMQYGLEKFCKDAQRVGIDGIIVPDLPMIEYQMNLKEMFNAHGIRNTFLISPQTSDERIKEIDDNTEGFIYMVSSASVTGAKTGISSEQVDYFKRIEAMKLKNPRLIGFGISDNKSFKEASSYSNGAIIGSAFVKLIGQSTDLPKDIKGFVSAVRGE
ncbi:tryptophan synthase subunit alpha [Flammeovirga kamogawensis]|uniref:Tryptophan synthase alpha chain n=1 Tax=Flammeovirga kamogawensis TaxID=373891 RepID=A0ABX8GRY8_9BACT|nr:tryptophan synthase subunit alpha [Flammeovirga kamogawensis]MBB6463102.1 tryptophan synthase alpha chain [Flammeovirga kamogawensis]QWG05735.1 tryptophan synthase subunit alpha [Flammeovirga kamogawensis]TRX67563.1 tryptophan synthase subunit alpha [Flammeovirga kamogawensis]